MTDRATSRDPLDALVYLVQEGFSVAVRSVYAGNQMHVRAVRGEKVLITEHRDLGEALRQIRDDSVRLLHKGKQG